MFYNDKTATLPIDEEFQKLWRSVAVESMDDQKIEEYLEKQVTMFSMIYEKAILFILLFLLQTLNCQCCES